MGTRYLATAALGGVAIALLIAGNPADAQPPPSVGQQCSSEGAMTYDGGGRRMWCAPPMTGDGLVWQYTPNNLPS